MEAGADWTASTLFSPSKALEQQAQAQDWASVDSWLSKKYPSRRVPQFERHDGSLQTLLTLASINEDTDERKSHVDRVERSALQALTKRQSQTHEGVSQLLSDYLDGCDALDTLAKLAVDLSGGVSDNASLAASVVDLTTSRFETTQHLSRITQQVEGLRAEQNRLSRFLGEIQTDDFVPAADLTQRTAEWTRNTKHLKAKIGEYEERLNSLPPSGQPTGIRIEQIGAQAEDLKTLQARLADCMNELQAFQSLPTNPTEARAHLESARDDLRRLMNQRDRMFEQLHEGAS